MSPWTLDIEHSILDISLRAAALLYGLAVRAHRAAYDRGLLRTRQLPVPVISVGNLVAGGTGKTPLVVYLARALRDRGRQAIVLSRGYGRRSRGIRIVSDGRNIERDWREVGDEPTLMAGLLPGIPIVVGRDRYEAGLWALDRFPADFVLLDDGLQHLRLARTVDIVVVDATDPFGGGHLLPRGLLREPLGALARAHMFCLTRTDQSDRVADLRSRLNALNPHVPIVETVHRPTGLRRISGGRDRPLSSLREGGVMAFSGIGRPASFERTLRGLGAQIVDAIRYPDHHPYTPQDLTELHRRATRAGADILVTTEKDAIRLPIEGTLDLPVLALGVELEVRKGADEFEAMLSLRH